MLIKLSRSLTVVFLHVRPKVSFFLTVSERAIADVLTLLASRYMHADLPTGRTNSLG